MAEEIIEAIERYGLSKRNRKRTLFSRIGVVGCGKEGSVIATTAALNGMEVVFLELSDEAIANAYARIGDKLDKKIGNWGLTENEKKAITLSIIFTFILFLLVLKDMRDRLKKKGIYEEGNVSLYILKVVITLIILGGLYHFVPEMIRKLQLF